MDTLFKIGTFDITPYLKMMVIIVFLMQSQFWKNTMILKMSIIVSFHNILGQLLC